MVKSKQRCSQFVHYWFGVGEGTSERKVTRSSFSRVRCHGDPVQTTNSRASLRFEQQGFDFLSTQIPLEQSLQWTLHLASHQDAWSERSCLWDQQLGQFESRVTRNPQRLCQGCHTHGSHWSAPMVIVYIGFLPLKFARSLYIVDTLRSRDYFRALSKGLPPLEKDRWEDTTLLPAREGRTGITVGLLRLLHKQVTW